MRTGLFSELVFDARPTWSTSAMRVSAYPRRLCNSCSYQILELFVSGLNISTKVARHGGKERIHNAFRHKAYFQMRHFTTSKPFRADVNDEELHGSSAARTSAQIEAIVRQARQTFGETLPQDFLSEEEYQVYERLYGPPSAVTLPEDVALLQGFEEEGNEAIEDLPKQLLMRENKEGQLEEIVFSEEDEIDEDGSKEFADEAVHEGPADIARSETREEFQARVAAFQDVSTFKTAENHNLDAKNEDEDLLEDEEDPDQDIEEQEVDDGAENLDLRGNAYERSGSARTHPLTAAGRFSTSPATVFLPRDTFVDPIMTLLADASNKHLADVAHKTFGGPGLPHSTATITRANLKQEPIQLEAKQFNMSEMEGNAFLAAVMPGAYASIMSTLVEVRKRLGSDWLPSLLRRPGESRILDAGAGGAGVLAWREVLKAEWESMHPDGSPEGRSVPHGKSTVVTGSAVLRHKASKLLGDTTFIPRLPDYDPNRDHPSLEGKNPQPRKQYDIIVAPHTLWTLREDHMRKSQIQNFWSLLDPRGGVLILIEKGVPRGFELIAGARETLLKHHIASPGAEEVELTIEDASENRFGPKEKGMIIAPCTNHGKCPMYITAGQSKGRKDFCHFSQRFIRPPYLQRILSAKDRNHEDIKFSYVALQRGVDQRQTDNFSQGQPATLAALEGYEEAAVDNEQEDAHPQRMQPVNMLGLPRAILPPIKRRGHVTLDLCTPGGKIERWTVPRSFSKQAYRDARKSRWGDLWALGAKTRVPRNIRVGLNKSKSEGRDIDLGGNDEPDEDRRSPRRENKFGNRVKSRKTVKHKKRRLVDEM